MPDELIGQSIIDIDSYDLLESRIVNTLGAGSGKGATGPEGPYRSYRAYRYYRPCRALSDLLVLKVFKVLLAPLMNWWMLTSILQALFQEMY